MDDARLLVVITGPIASGKSTVARLLADDLAENGRFVSVVDLDELAFAQRRWASLDQLWHRAGVAAAALVRTWFETGIDVVVAHGPFFEGNGYQLLLGLAPTDIEVRHVLLRVEPELALKRVAGDTTRGMSRDPAFLLRAHDRFAAIEPTLPAADAVFDTSTSTADEVAAALWNLLSPT